MSKEILIPGRDQLRRGEGWGRIEPSGALVREISDQLRERVYGQEHALESISKAIARTYAGLVDPRRPAFVGLLAGPTGSGKTETARALTPVITGQDDFLKIDCGTLNTEHSIYRLLGAPPSYVGYGDRVLITPEHLNGPNVILLDEIEKAHPAVWRLLLGVFDSGKMSITVSKGSRGYAEQKELDFRMSYFLLTCNAGARDMQRAMRGGGMGFRSRKKTTDLQKVGEGAVLRHFQHMPEFVNRLDDIIVYQPIPREVYPAIVSKFLNEANEQFHAIGNPIFLTPQAIEKISDMSWEQRQWGGRAIKRIFETEILTPISEMMFDGSIGKNEAVVIDFQDRFIAYKPK